MKKIKTNQPDLFTRPSLFRVGRPGRKYDGDLNNLFGPEEVFIAYGILKDLDDELIKSSPLCHLFEQAYPEPNEDLSQIEYSAKLRYNSYSTVQDALLRYVTCTALQLVDVMPVRDADNPEDHLDRFLDAYDLLVRKVKCDKHKMLSDELIADSKSEIWRIMYRLLCDHKVHSEEMSGANFADWVEQYVIDSKLVNHSKVEPQLFDDLADTKTFSFLKQSISREYPVPYLETETLSKMMQIKDRVMEGSQMKVMERFTNIAIFGSKAMDITRVASMLLTDEKDQLLNWRAMRMIPAKYLHNKQASELNFDF